MTEEIDYWNEGLRSLKNLGISLESLKPTLRYRKTPSGIKWRRTFRNYYPHISTQILVKISSKHILAIRLDSNFPSKTLYYRKTIPFIFLTPGLKYRKLSPCFELSFKARSYLEPIYNEVITDLIRQLKLQKESDKQSTERELYDASSRLICKIQSQRDLNSSDQNGRLSLDRSSGGLTISTEK